MSQLADRNMKVFEDEGITERNDGSDGTNKTTGKTVRGIKSLMANKRYKEIVQDKMLRRRLMQ